MADKTILECYCGNMEEIGSAGWGIVSTFDGKIKNVCPECRKELKEIAKRIYEITGEKYVSISGFLRD